MELTLVLALICVQNWLRFSPLSMNIKEHLKDLEKLEEGVDVYCQ